MACASCVTYSILLNFCFLIVEGRYISTYLTNLLKWANTHNASIIVSSLWSPLNPWLLFDLCTSEHCTWHRTCEYYLNKWVQVKVSEMIVFFAIKFYCVRCLMNLSLISVGYRKRHCKIFPFLIVWEFRDFYKGLRGFAGGRFRLAAQQVKYCVQSQVDKG